MSTNFEDIIFNESDHAYTLYGQPLSSVTQVIGRLKSPFDTSTAATRVAERAGRDPADVLAEWEQKRRTALERGTTVHKYVAAKILSSSDCLSSRDDKVINRLNTPHRLPEMDAFDRFWDDNSKHNRKGQVEWVVGDAELGIAGTVDAMFWNSIALGNVIFDWKTGGKFATENRWENLLPPFNNLPNCELSIYSLQTSLYRLIIERNEGEVESCTIVHLNNEGQITPYQAMDLRDQLFTWLTARSSSNGQ